MATEHSIAKYQVEYNYLKDLRKRSVMGALCNSYLDLNRPTPVSNFCNFYIN